MNKHYDICTKLLSRSRPFIPSYTFIMVLWQTASHTLLQMQNLQKLLTYFMDSLFLDFPSGKKLMSCMRDMLGHVYNLSINSSRTQSRRQSLVVNARIDPICLFRKYFFYILHTYQAFKDPVGILNYGWNSKILTNFCPILLHRNEIIFIWTFIS